MNKWLEVALQVVVIVPLIGLATYRLSRLIAREHGPFNIFSTLRQWAQAWASGTPSHSIANFMAGLLSCPLCLGVYVAGGLLAAAYLPGVAGQAVWFVILWGAIAGLAAWLQMKGG